MKSCRVRFPSRSQGSTLIVFVSVIILMLGLLGVAIYSGLQTFLHGELQKAASGAAMVGSSVYYSLDDEGHAVGNPALADAVARSTFEGTARASSLGGFEPRIKNVDTSNGKVVIDVVGALGTPLLAPLGIDKILMESRAVSVPLKYEPVTDTQPLRILPSSSSIASFNRVLHLKYPIADKPGKDFVIEQDPADQQGYVVEACNDSLCYDLGAGAAAMGSGRIEEEGGAYVIYGSAVFDLTPLEIAKASRLRITHGNNFSHYYQNGVSTPMPNTPRPLVINKISIYGYSGACPDNGNCPVPFGFAAVP